MTNRTMLRRLFALEDARASVPARMTEQEIAEAAAFYEERLNNPEPSDPRAVAYWERADVHQLASDYDAMLKGAPAPWEV